MVTFDHEVNLCAPASPEAIGVSSDASIVSGEVSELAVSAAEYSEQQSLVAGELLRIAAKEINPGTIQRIAAKPGRKRRQHEASENSSGIDETDLIGLYLDDMRRYDLLTKDDEVRLAGLIAKAVEAQEELGDKNWVLSSSERRRLRGVVAKGLEAREEFIGSNMRLVANIAKNYLHSKVSYLDLIQHGTIGLMRAVDLFDASKGFKFSTYATAWIKQSIGRGIDNTSRTIRVPIGVLDDIRSVQKARALLVMELGRYPNEAEIVKRTNLSLAQVRNAVSYEKGAISYDVPIGEEGGLELKDMLADDGARVPFESIIEEEDIREAHEMLESLNDEEQMVLDHIFGLNGVKAKSIYSIAKLNGVSSAKITRIRDMALGKLKHPSSPKYFNNTEETESNIWRNSANCLGAPAEVFYPPARVSTKAAHKICSLCPVKVDCLNFALENDERHGVWGDTEPGARVLLQIRRAKAGNPAKVSTKA